MASATQPSTGTLRITVHQQKDDPQDAEIEAVFLWVCRHVGVKTTTTGGWVGSCPVQGTTSHRATWRYVVTSTTRWQERLMELCTLFVAVCRERGRLPDRMPIVSTQSTTFFPLKCCTGHSTDVSRMMFGTLVNNGTFDLNWIVEGGCKMDLIRMNILYDSETIEIHYFTYARDVRDARKFNLNWKVKNHNKLTIKFKSIKRILIDQRTDNTFGLTLCVDFPPKLQNHFQLKCGVRDGPLVHFTNCTEGYFLHTLSMDRGRTWTEVADTHTLHDSTTIGFEVKESKTFAIFEVAGRLHHKTGKPIEFCSLNLVNNDHLDGFQIEASGYRGKRIGPGTLDSKAQTTLLNEAFKNLREDASRSNTHVEQTMFAIHAHVDGILQRGTFVRHQLCRDAAAYSTFARIIANGFRTDEKRLLSTLERVMSVLSNTPPNCNVTDVVLQEWKAYNSSTASEVVTLLSKKERDKDYTRVYKVVITQTRMFFTGVETIMTNRFLKRFNVSGTEVVRISFRDDSGGNMYPFVTGPKIMKDRMVDVFTNGIVFGGRRYVWVGNSNSQLRDQGAYMIHDAIQVSDTWNLLGKFNEQKSIVKFLARMGLCFTQARPSKISIARREMDYIDDFIGGMKHDKDEPYTFSDGVGTISLEFAVQLAKELQLHYVPSAFQIRHGGEKGMVSIDVHMDEVNDLWERIKMQEKKGMLKPRMKFYARPSMSKFEAHSAQLTSMEIVKWSAPTELFLNKPFINILDQVSMKQSAASNERICQRILYLLDRRLASAYRTLHKEADALEAILGMNTPLRLEGMNTRGIVELTVEPFFRSMLFAYVAYVIQKQLTKMHIPILKHQGRTMFGIVDTTGTLQYGQVFFQYSRNMTTTHKRGVSMHRADAVRHIGPVLVTKNPMRVSGDVRMLEAVDAPGLHHLVDVIVFPQHGHRPHPDEMAGSDLDGDEYSVIWDEELFFERNEDPMLFDSHETPAKWRMDRDTPADTIKGKLIEFLVEVLTTESIGMISNAHLATSDLIGLDNDVSMSIAKKASQVLDFPKTGASSCTAKLTTADESWGGDRVRIREKPARKPEFMEKPWEPAYSSRGLLGTTHREMTRNLLAMEVAEHCMNKIDVDVLIDEDDWEDCREAAKRELHDYNDKIRDLLTAYGIASEAELLSGCIREIKNPLSDREADDYAMYNTSKVIEEKLSVIVEGARERFFEELCPGVDWKTYLTPHDRVRNRDGKETITDYFVSNPTEQMRRKAVAIYKVAYESAKEALAMDDRSGVLLSMPWLFVDILVHVKRQRVQAEAARLENESRAEEASRLRIPRNSPISDALRTFIKAYSDEHSADRKAYTDSFKRKDPVREAIMAHFIRYKGIRVVCYVFHKWMVNSKIFDEAARFDETHAAALLIAFAIGKYGNCDTYMSEFVDGQCRLVDSGRLLLDFFTFLRSREFGSRKSLDFGGIIDRVLLRGQWIPLHKAAVMEHLGLITNQCLPVPGTTDSEHRSLNSLREMTPFIAELPGELVKTKLPNIINMLKEISGVTDLEIRLAGNDWGKVRVSAIGTPLQFEKLREVLIPEPPPREAFSRTMEPDVFARIVVSKMVEAYKKS